MKREVYVSLLYHLQIANVLLLVFEINKNRAISIPQRTTRLAIVIANLSSLRRLQRFIGCNAHRFIPVLTHSVVSGITYENRHEGFIT